MTPKLRQPESKSFHCQHCKHILGRTDGARLYIGDCAFPFVVTIICQVCNGITKWKPLIRPVDVAEYANRNDILIAKDSR